MIVKSLLKVLVFVYIFVKFGQGNEVNENMMKDYYEDDERNKTMSENPATETTNNRSEVTTEPHNNQMTKTKTVKRRKMKSVKQIMKNDKGMQLDMHNGKPMMCYTKMKSSKQEGSKMIENLLDQAARLLGVVIQKTEGSNDVTAMTLKQISKMLQNTIKANESKTGEEESHEDEENTKLGLELLEILKNLQLKNLALPESKDGQMANVQIPMNDEPVRKTETPLEPIAGNGLVDFDGIVGFDLAGLGLSGKDVLALMNDSNTSMFLTQLGLSAIADVLKDKEIANLFTQLNVADVQRLLQSMQAIGQEEGLNLDAILKIIAGFQGSKEEMPTSTEAPLETTSSESLPSHDEKLGFSLASLGFTEENMMNVTNDPNISLMFTALGLRPLLAGIKDREITNLILNLDVAILQRLLISGQIINEDGTINLEALVRALAENQERGANEKNEVEGEEKMKNKTREGEYDTKEMGNRTTKMENEDVKSTIKIFQRILAMAGVKGEVNKNNIFESTMKAIENITSADGESLQVMMELLTQLLGEMDETNRTKVEKGKMTAEFERLLAVIGIGDVTPDNLLKSMTKMLQFVMNADDKTLKMLSEVFKEEDEKDEMEDGEGKTLKGMREGEEQQPIMAVFDRVMALVGIGDVTADNLLESMKEMLHFVMNANDETVKILVEIFQEEDGKGEMVGRKGKTLQEMREGEEQPIMAVFDRIMALTGIGGEVDEDNILESITKAIENITSADGESLQVMMELLTQLSGGMEANKTTNVEKGKMTPVFERLLAVAGIGDVTNDNLLESIMKLMQFVMTADDKTVKMLAEIFKEDEKKEMGGGKGKTLQEGANQNIMAVFDRIMALAGIGDVTTDNLLESMIKLMQFVTNADDKTVKMFEEIFKEEDEKEEMEGKKGKTLKEMREGEEQNIMAVFDRIMALVEIEGKVTEDNMLRSSLKAMQYILTADDESLQALIDALGDFDLSVLEIIDEEGMEDKEEEEKSDEVYEMVCYPMNEEDMKEYIHMKEPKPTMSVGTQTMTTSNLPTGRSTGADNIDSNADHSKEKCTACEQNMEEMKSMMQEMIQTEIQKVFNDVVTGMNSMSFVAPQIKAMMEKLANGQKYEEEEQKEDRENKFKQWTEWDDCSASCGGGIKIRTRDCKEEYINTMEDEKNGCGEDAQSELCNTQACGGTGTAGVDATTSLRREWTEWSLCTRTCGRGMTSRTRKCSNSSSPNCKDISETKECNIANCRRTTPTPRKGKDREDKFKQWTEWDDCSASCGGGIKIRTRDCKEEYINTMEDEENGCGEDAQSELCNTQACGGTGAEGVNATTSLRREWTEWSLCTRTCGRGMTTRTRKCTNSSSPNCKDISETKECNMADCRRTTPTPRKGIWGSWNRWSSCSRSCGGGARSRSRSCNGADLCSGRAKETESCNQQQCLTAAPTTTTIVSATMPAITRVATGTCPPSSHKHLMYKNRTSNLETCIVFHGRETGKKSFNDYRSYCQQRGGDIVRLDVVDKWLKVTYWLKGASRAYSDKKLMPWIGATDASGDWSHPATPSHKPFMIWYSKNPQPADYSQCASLDVSRGHAKASDCTAHNYAVCEY